MIITIKVDEPYSQKAVRAFMAAIHIDDEFIKSIKFEKEDASR